MKWIILFILIPAMLLAAAAPRRDATKDDDAYAPHTPTLLFRLSGLTSRKDAEAINTSVAKLPSVRKIDIDTVNGRVEVRFDSHVVSYHQVAQAIADAGMAVEKQFDPRIKISVPEYAHGDNAAKVDAVFAGKRLNQRVHIEPLDKTKGEFLVHFLPLQANAGVTGPQGFNGGHLHHPVSDPPPRGLGLELTYDAGPERPSADNAKTGETITR